MNWRERLSRKSKDNQNLWQNERDWTISIFLTANYVSSSFHSLFHRPIHHRKWSWCGKGRVSRFPGQMCHKIMKSWPCFPNLLYSSEMAGSSSRVGSGYCRRHQSNFDEEWHRLAARRLSLREVTTNFIQLKWKNFQHESRPGAQGSAADQRFGKCFPFWVICKAIIFLEQR